MAIGKKTKDLLIRWLVVILMRTLQWEIKGIELLENKHKATLLTTWHDELAFVCYILHQKSVKTWMVVSQHQDGQLIANLLEHWQFPLIRGSTHSKGAVTTTKKMLTLLSAPGNIVTLTADGPKGPRHQAKPGSIRIAQRCGADIVMIRPFVSHCWRLRSWDRFIIPKPFSKVSIIIEKANQENHSGSDDNIAIHETLTMAMQAMSPRQKAKSD